MAALNQNKAILFENIPQLLPHYLFEDKVNFVYASSNQRLAEFVDLSSAVESRPNRTGKLQTALHTPPSQLRWRVLLIEDHRLVQMTVKNQLMKLGCDVDVAGNGQAALEFTVLNHYDLIFSDIDLPDIDGITVASIIRRNQNNLNNRTPIVASTTYLTAERQQLCLAAGMQRALTKPLRSNQVYEVLVALAPI